MKGYEHVLAFALEHPWNLTPPMLALVAGILARRVAGVEVDRTEIAAALVNRKNLPQPRRGSVAILPVYGVIAPRMNLFSEMSGGTTFQQLSLQLRAAMGKQDVKTIVLDIDSPGGSVAGNTEFAAEVMKARTKKPIVAQAQYTMASAAYQIAAAATEIVAAPSARVGAIGTYSIHNDLSAALEQLGIKRTYISAGEGKVDGNEAEPLSESAQARIQLAVDQAYDQFVATVVQGRGEGVTAARVRSEWKAYGYGAADAKKIGMVDRVATLDETLERLLDASGDPEDRAAIAQLDLDPADTPQTSDGRSGQDRRLDAALELSTLELQLANVRE